MEEKERSGVIWRVYLAGGRKKKSFHPELVARGENLPPRGEIIINYSLFTPRALLAG